MFVSFSNAIMWNGVMEIVESKRSVTVNSDLN